MDSKKTIVKLRFKCRYFRTLSIIDHIREIMWLYDNEYKPKKDETNITKELADLKILLDIHFDSDMNLINSRIERFIENINKEVKST